MPIFEYKCKNCGYKFERLVFEEEKIKCPKCKNDDLKKLVSSFAIGKNSKSSGDKSATCSGGICDINCPTCGN